MMVMLKGILRCCMDIDQKQSMVEGNAKCYQVYLLPLHPILNLNQMLLFS